MSESFDVIVVGARCAGSPLAALLARSGAKVAVLERATFPRDTLSTHIFQAEALCFLDRLGVMDEIHGTGAPMLWDVDVRQEDFKVRTRVEPRPGDVGGSTSVRRFVLDPILAGAAAQAGAEIRMGTKVTGVAQERGRVVGVRVGQNGSETTLQAKLVVGADGRNSTIAEHVGARKYNVTPSERFAYWSFFEGADLGPDPALVFHRWGTQFVLACPTDSGLYQVIVIPELSELPAFRADLERSFMEHATRCEPVAAALAGAQRVGKILGIVRWEGFFRDASGPGWVLAGDAGYFKDPSPGQGIQDAFRQADRLAPAILRGLAGSPEVLDRELAEWGRWRDEDAAEHYWFATDLGKAGPAPKVLPEVAGRMFAQGKFGPFVDLFSHRATPSKVVSPPRVLAATARLLARPGCDRKALLREVGGLIAEDTRRKRMARRPVYAAAATTDAGETEIEQAVAA